jgi:hypothetical protein
MPAYDFASQEYAFHVIQEPIANRIPSTIMKKRELVLPVA